MVTPKNIIVADNNNTRNTSLAVVLQRLGYNVFVATQGKDLLRFTHSFIPHLVLLDLGMPMIEGQTCLEKIRSNKTLSIAKVVTMSDESNAVALEASLGKGANAYIFTPADTTRLYQIIQELTEIAPRKVLRVRVVFKVTLEAEKNRSQAFATVLSEGGVFVRTMNPMAVGAKVTVSMDLPTSKPVVLDGEVIYDVGCNTGEFHEPGMCIRFVDIKEEERLWIRKFVEGYLAWDLDPKMLA